MRLTHLAAAVALALSQTATAAEPIKICSAESELPYSNKDDQGFENKLAELIGQELGRPVENVWWSDPRYYVRDLLDKGLCDVTLGVDAGDPRLATTQPYYRSGYVFVYRKEKGVKIDNWDSEILRTAQHIAFMPDTPAETMLRKIGRYNDQFNYLQSLVGYKSRRNQYVRFDPAKLVDEVAIGNAEVAVLWGPAAARYVKASNVPLVMSVIPDDNVRSDGEKVPHHYDTAIGVRKGDDTLLAQLNQAIAKRGKDIRALLQAEGIPLLADDAAKTASVNKKKAHKS
jgi:mxaJ protein